MMDSPASLSTFCRLVVAWVGFFYFLSFWYVSILNCVVIVLHMKPMEVKIVLLMLPVQEILIYGVAFCTLRSPWMSFQRLPSCLPNRGSQTKFFLIAFIGFCYCPPTSYLCWILHGIWSCCFFRDLLTCQDFFCIAVHSCIDSSVYPSVHPSIYTLGNRNLYHGSHVHYDFTGNCVLRRTRRRYTSG